MAQQAAVCSEFDYFKPTTAQDMILEEYDEPIAALPISKFDQPVMFEIPAQDGIYRDLNNSYMVIKLKVTKADGTALTAGTDVVAPTNLLLSSLFKTVEVKLNGVLVSHANSLHAYRAYIETLLTYSEAVLNTRGALEGWCKDDAGKMDGITFTGGAENAAFIARNKWISAGAVLTLVGRPHADIFHQDLDIPPGVAISLKFSPNETKFVLQAAANATFKIEPVEQRFYVRSKRLSAQAIAAHKEMCEQFGGYRIPITKVVMNMHDLAGAAKEISSLVPGDSVPTRVVLGFVSTTAINGAFAENPFNFKPLGLTDLQVHAGGESFPREALKMNFATGDYELAYLNTLAAISLDTGNRALAITPSEWSTSYNLYAFKLQPGPLDYGGSHAVLPKTGSCKANLAFSSAVAGVHLLVFAEIPGLVHISETGKVTIV